MAAWNPDAVQGLPGLAKHADAANGTDMDKPSGTVQNFYFKP